MDRTLCKGGKCLFKKDCYRYNAKPSKYQSYFVKEPFRYDRCEYFWGDSKSVESVYSYKQV